MEFSLKIFLWGFITDALYNCWISTEVRARIKYIYTKNGSTCPSMPGFQLRLKLTNLELLRLIKCYPCHNLCGPFHWRVFAHNLINSMEISPCCNSFTAHQMARNLCTCLNNTVVVSCAKFCSHHFVIIEVAAKRNSHQIWIAIEKLLVKWVCGLFIRPRLRKWCVPTKLIDPRIRQTSSSMLFALQTMGPANKCQLLGEQTNNCWPWWSYKHHMPFQKASTPRMNMNRFGNQDPWNNAMWKCRIRPCH